MPACPGHFGSETTGSMTEKQKHIVIVTDAWKPQVNGVVRTLENVGKKMEEHGYKVTYITPEDFHTVPMPSYPEIPVAIWPKKDTVFYKLGTLKPDYIYIATEGTLGHAAVNYCNRHHLNYTTGYHTKFPEYLRAARVPLGESIGYAVLKRFHGRSSHIMVPTASVAEDLKTHGFKNVVTWTRGVDTHEFHPGKTDIYQKLGIPEEEKVFLNVGRVSVEKGLEDFLKLDLPGKKVVVGKGPALETLKARYPDALFLGEKRGEELGELYRSADVFVFPSKTDTFGNVQLEAMASGVPVAAYPVAGPIDVITDPKVGVLDDDLKTACLKALELKKQGCEQDCTDFVTTNYQSWDKTARMLEDHLVHVGAPNSYRRQWRDVWDGKEPRQGWMV